MRLIPVAVRRAAPSVVLLPAFLIAACTSGGQDDPAPGPTPTGTASVRAISTSAPPSPTAKPSAIQKAPDPSVLPSSRDATAVSTVRRNELGVPWTLDAAAAASCAQAEFALTDLDSGEDPSAHVAEAVAAVKPSTSTAVVEAAAALAPTDGAVDRPAVVSFLTVCTQGGYEL